MRQLLAESRSQGGGMLDGGFAGDTVKQMLDEAIADKMTAAGGVGMTAMFTKHLGDTGEVGRSPGPPLANAPIDAPIANPPIANAPGMSAAPNIPEGVPHFVLLVAGRPSAGCGPRADPVHGHMVNHAGLILRTRGTEGAAAAPGTVVQAGSARDLWQPRHAASRADSRFVTPT